MSDIVIYEDGEIHLKLSLEEDTFWLDESFLWMNVESWKLMCMIKPTLRFYFSFFL